MIKTNIAPKKLLIIINALGMGGAEHMIYELVKFLNREEYDPEIVCYGPKQENALENKVSQICKVRYLGLTGKITLQTMKKVFSVMTEIRPDIVHAHQGGVSFAIPWCARHRVPLCITVHSKPQQAFSKINHCMIKIFKNILRMRLVAVSKENLTLVQDFYKLSDKKSEFINNGVDIERFYKTQHDRYTFINVARQDENKNQIAIIRATHQIKKSGRDVQLLLVGDGPCHESLQAEVRALGLTDSVIFPGQVSDPALYYAQSDVYVQTSFREALPLSVLEAMATGLPIIATNVGGLRDVVDQNGILIEAGDDDALLSAMLTIMDASESEYESMAQYSKNMVKGYSSGKMAEQYEKAYDKLLNK